MVCNQVLREIPPGARGAGVPGEFPRYWRCDSCARTYWWGSRYRRTRQFLEALAGPA